ncbi:hypothetical protein NQ315_008394 [Exocentrus adspersus]|uniref:Major facilitator superfamily (MFS) profile domain-containing protein n=1 Tax=Exocentrus adspersus TaxID=1586481 RepID=A0AAV8W5Q1_9CUCU|nr:hypothetical protein NQ315_008394 [Exocentrus adspersus]
MDKAEKDIEKNGNFESVYKPLTYEISKPQLFTTEKKSDKRNTWFLYFTSLTADLLMFDCGCNFTWTSPALSTLKSPDANINPLGVPVTPWQISWIAALINLGAAVGPLAFGKLPDVFGRRKVLIFIAISKIISYIILALAHNIYLFYLGRFLMGIGLGLSFSVMPMFTVEISEDHNRGKLASIMGVFATLGMLYTLIVGPLLSLKIFTLSCTSFLVVALISFVTVTPETPTFLVSIGKMSSAEKSLMKLRNSERVDQDLIQLSEMTEKGNSKSKITDIFRTPSLRKGIIICLSLCSLQHLSGIFPIMAFIGPIFEVTGSRIPVNLSVILVSVIQLIANIVSSIIIEKLGRKPLLLLSTIGACLSLLSLGFYFYLKECESSYLQSIFWLPVTSLVFYMVSFSIGLTSVPMTILSEIFPSEVRAVATSFVTFFGASTGFLVTFIFPIVTMFFGEARCFWLFAGFTALGAAFIYFVIPETKGKSISEIQKVLGSKETN